MYVRMCVCRPAEVCIKMFISMLQALMNAPLTHARMEAPARTTPVVTPASASLGTVGPAANSVSTGCLPAIMLSEKDTNLNKHKGK